MSHWSFGGIDGCEHLPMTNDQTRVLSWTTTNEVGPTRDEPAKRVASRSLGREPQAPQSTRVEPAKRATAGSGSQPRLPRHHARCRPRCGLDPVRHRFLGLTPQATGSRPLRGLLDPSLFPTQDSR